VKDDTLARLYTLMATLTEQLAAAESARARLTKALAADAWPEVQVHAPVAVRSAGER